MPKFYMKVIAEFNVFDAYEEDRVGNEDDIIIKFKKTPDEDKELFIYKLPGEGTTIKTSFSLCPTEDIHSGVCEFKIEGRQIKVSCNAIFKTDIKQEYLSLFIDNDKPFYAGGINLERNSYSEVLGLDKEIVKNIFRGKEYEEELSLIPITISKKISDLEGNEPPV